MGTLDCDNHPAENETHNLFCFKLNFVTVSETLGLVDKTMLINSVFMTGRRILITAPRKFDKSTNLDMIRTFLSLESENNEDMLHIFKNLTIHENNSMFFGGNFAKHPVLFVDCKFNKVCPKAYT